MNILILNWRDPLNSSAGGAEKLNMRILEPLIKRGDKIIWYAKREKGQKRVEELDGVKIVRFGNVFTHFLVWPFFILNKKFGKIDLVFDCIHGIGYFTPMFMPNTKRKVLIYEVAQNLWDEMFSAPVGLYGRTMEKIMFFIYKTSDFWTISKSTKEDLLKMGIESKRILILPMGFDAPKKIKKYSKFKEPTALFVGRLVEMKGIKDAIKAIGETKDWQLNVIGRGTEKFERELGELVEELGLKKRVKFMGFVSETKKFEEMSKAWVLLVPSSREGWGMIIPEANYMGTQVIGYNSPGIRDSLPYYSDKNILIDQNPESITKAIKKIKKPLMLKMQKKPGWIDLKKFTFSYKNQ